MSDAVIVINDYRGLKTQRRTRSSGKQTTTLAISGEPIAVMLDEKALSAPVVAKYVEVLKGQIRAISFEAAPATKAKREAQARAFSAGESWAVKEFAGGRIGAMPPNQTSKAYRNSGRLEAGITATWVPSAKEWVIRLPHNRFAPDFLSRPGGQAVLDRLVDLCSALRNPLTTEVVDELRRVQDAMVLKGRSDNARAGAELAVRGLQLVARLVAA